MTDEQTHDKIKEFEEKLVSDQKEVPDWVKEQLDDPDVRWELYDDYKDEK